MFWVAPRTRCSASLLLMTCGTRMVKPSSMKKEQLKPPRHSYQFLKPTMHICIMLLRMYTIHVYIYIYMYIYIYIQTISSPIPIENLFQSPSKPSWLHLSAEDLEHGFSTSFTLLHLRLTGDLWKSWGPPSNKIEHNSAKFIKIQQTLQRLSLKSWEPFMALRGQTSWEWRFNDGITRI